MEAARPRQLAPGTMLDDRYRIERLLAEGGMGAVYEGTHVLIRKRVAIKVLNPQLSTPAMVERFHREAITASQIPRTGPRVRRRSSRSCSPSATRRIAIT